MAVKIRLRRMGQKKAPFYRIVVADSRSPRDGKCIDEIGTFDPNTDPSTYKVDEEAAKTVHRLQKLLTRSSKMQESSNKRRNLLNTAFGGGL